MAKEKLFTTHAATAGETYVEGEEGFQCASCEEVEAEEAWMKVHVYERHGPGPGPLPEDNYTRNLALPEEAMRYKCKLCWHPTPGLKHMLFHLRRAHDIKPGPWEVSRSLSNRFFDVLAPEAEPEDASG